MMLFVRRGALVAAALLLGACADATTAPTAPVAATPSFEMKDGPGAIRSTLTYLDEIWEGEIVQFTCQDGRQSEPIQLSGQMFERHAFMLTPSGRTLHVESSMPVGVKGVGLVTGQEYRVADRTQGTAHYDENDAGGGSRHETLLLRGLETGETYGITYIIQWRMGGPGEILVNRWKEMETCRP